MPTKSKTTTLHIPILYGSQTGNSQSCAETLASTLPKTLRSQQQISNIKITSSAKQLDDFLEFDHASWPRYFIIICSSYGVGQAPLGCWKFRELCDAILDDTSANATNKKMMNETTLQGIQYSMLGLGDSKYSTFFLNPTAIDSALHKVGAIRAGKLGKADASGTGDNTQSIVMNKWCEDILTDVVRVVNEIVKESEEDRENMESLLKKAKEETGELCKEIFDDWEEEDGKGKNQVGKGDYSTSGFMILVVAVLAVVVALTMKK